MPVLSMPWLLNNREAESTMRFRVSATSTLDFFAYFSPLATAAYLQGSARAYRGAHC